MIEALASEWKAADLEKRDEIVAQWPKAFGERCFEEATGYDHDKVNDSFWEFGVWGNEDETLAEFLSEIAQSLEHPCLRFWQLQLDQTCKKCNENFLASMGYLYPIYRYW